MIENQTASKKKIIDYQPGRDLLSDLPLSIIHDILALVPIREAVRTSVLSRQWRYTWTSLPYLVFENGCASLDDDVMYNYGECVTNIISHALFRHKGPIQKFKMSVSFLDYRPNIDEWVLCLSRNDIRELIIDMGWNDAGWPQVYSSIYSSIYSCEKLTYLNLINCGMDPPPKTFKGFLFLKCLDLVEVILSSEGIESLVANCPLLEKLLLMDFENPKLRISSPNLNYLLIVGYYIEIWLCAPLLAEMVVDLRVSKNNFTAKHIQQNTSVRKYINFLDGLANLEKLSGEACFIEYLSVGLGSCQTSLAFHHLKVIELKSINFDDIKQISAVARLTIGAPNLQKLELSDIEMVESGGALESLDVSFKNFRRAPNFTFGHLRVVTIDRIGGLPLLIEFIQFLLESSPVLDTMTIGITSLLRTKKIRRLMADIRGFSCASPDAELSVFWM